jgi:pyruvate/2-oxoglutarate dehydrogenase complex dihydrolipoamide dehydrogenase (E3) component
LGVDVFLGNATFENETMVSINEKMVKFTKACIATGGRPRVPDYPGIDKTPYYTSDTIFNLKMQPKKMLVIGGGPIAMELG